MEEESKFQLEADEEKSNNFELNAGIDQFESQEEFLKKRVEELERQLTEKDIQIVHYKKEVVTLKLQLRTIQLQSPENVNAMSFILKTCEKARLQAERRLERSENKVEKAEQKVSDLAALT